MDTVLGLIGIIVFAACVIALAAAVTWVVVKVSPAEKPDKPEAGVRRRRLDRRQRQDVLERRVVEAVRLGDGLVGDLAVEHVDAARERAITGDRLARARGSRSPRRTAASRSSAPSST